MPLYGPPQYLLSSWKNDCGLRPEMPQPLRHILGLLLLPHLVVTPLLGQLVLPPACCNLDLREAGARACGPSILPSQEGCTVYLKYVLLAYSGIFQRQILLHRQRCRLLLFLKSPDHTLRKVPALKGNRSLPPAPPCISHCTLPFPYSAASPHQDGMPLYLLNKNRGVLKQCFLSRHALQLLTLSDTCERKRPWCHNIWSCCVFCLWVPKVHEDLHHVPKAL